MQQQPYAADLSIMFVYGMSRTGFLSRVFLAARFVVDSHPQTNVKQAAWWLTLFLPRIWEIFLKEVHMVRREGIPPPLLPTDIHFLIPNTTIRRCFIKCWGVWVKLKQMSPQGLPLQCWRAAFLGKIILLALYDPLCIRWKNTRDAQDTQMITFHHYNAEVTATSPDTDSYWCRFIGPTVCLLHVQ